ncbi:hypothetical protein GCM10009865_49500 [Aeromicrobium ponti]|uniref:Uncharacterized protein n=1 Tax=Cytobacillus oceanisediminis TaxID=665099 RepID=A0A562J8W0_9BACI|nr:hypothetical protein [Cytobacillus oceanisediminis]TWH79609.1 hypothetical protein IQ19_04821 [Cytobacillus oceanisediminis]
MRRIGIALLVGGLILFMSGIYLSAFWSAVGTFIGIIGGIAKGSASYFLAKTCQKKLYGEFKVEFYMV